VWRALTDPDLLARWLMPNTFRLAAGHQFTFTTAADHAAGFDGTVHCRVLGFDEPRWLRISWRAGSLDTTVTWTLEPEGTGTRLFLRLAGFDPGDPIHQHTRDILGGGWRSHGMQRLDEVLKTVAAEG
jgi:uncharacterized protein YndB with AHSA1/START domain